MSMKAASAMNLIQTVWRKLNNRKIASRVVPKCKFHTAPAISLPQVPWAQCNYGLNHMSLLVLIRLQTYRGGFSWI